MTLPNGRVMPALGLGTWNLKGEACVSVVREALKLGYRHVDTAEVYGNEEEVGTAIARSGVPREELFVTTKIWTTHHKAGDVRQAADDSLKRLRLSNVDLLLIHRPNPEVPLAETVGALCDVARAGKTAAIGVSNFSPRLMTEAVAISAVPIACNQISYSLAAPEDGVAFLTWREATPVRPVLAAYRPLGRGSFLDHRNLVEVAGKHRKTPAQVALRWLIRQPQVAAIPKASSTDHLQANLDVFTFDLDAEDLRQLAGVSA